MSAWKYRWIPVRCYDVTGMEAWLEAVSEEGLELAGVVGPIALFRSVEARGRACHLAPATLFLKEKEETELLQYWRCGWERVANIENLFCVFMSTVPSPVEVAIGEEEAEKCCRAIAKKQVFYGYMTLVWLALYVIFGLRPYYLRWGLFGGLLKGPVISFLVLTMVGLWAFFHGVSVVVYLERAKKRLRGAALGKGKMGWRGRAIAKRVFLGAVILVLVGMAVLMPSKNERKGTRNYVDVAETLPILALKDIEGEAFEYVGRVTPSGIAIDNALSYEWSLLAPLSYEVVQTGEKASLTAYYCRTVSAWLASGYCHERLTEIESAGTVSEVLSGGLAEEGWIWRSGDCQRILFRKGAIVVEYEYRGENLLEEQFDRMVALVAR